MITRWISRNCSERDSRPDGKVLIGRSNQSVRSQMEARMSVHICSTHDIEIRRCLVHGVTDGRVQGNDAQNRGACMQQCIELERIPLTFERERWLDSFAMVWRPSECFLRKVKSTSQRNISDVMCSHCETGSGHGVYLQVPDFE